MRDLHEIAAESAVWGPYASYDDVARFEYGRRLWRLPEMRRRLLELPQAKSVEILSVGRDYATLEIAYPGGPDDLAAALARQGLAMRNDEGRWVISDASALPPVDDSAEPAPSEQEVPGR